MIQTQKPIYKKVSSFLYYGHIKKRVQGAQPPAKIVPSLGRGLGVGENECFFFCLSLQN